MVSKLDKWQVVDAGTAAGLADLAMHEMTELADRGLPVLHIREKGNTETWLQGGEVLIRLQEDAR